PKKPSAPPTIPQTDTGTLSGPPVGIPSFSMVKEGKMASGRKPDLDGLDWLRENHFKAVLHLRRPGATDSADKEQIEKRGLKYLSIEISATMLSKQAAQEFIKLVNDAGNEQVFVYDADGVRAGIMWYLYFRLSEKMPAELSKIRAARLGLREGGGE